MSEYAIRKVDGMEIRIGTCTDMYNLRYEDRRLVYKIPGNVDPRVDTNLTWRLPFAEEDHIAIGMYSNVGRSPTGSSFKGFPLVGFSSPEMVNDVGYTVLSNATPSKAGISVRVPCYHGERLPDIEGCNVFWSDRFSYIRSPKGYELIAVKNDATLGLRPIVECSQCGKRWTATWDAVLPYITDETLLKRLLAYMDL